MTSTLYNYWYYYLIINLPSSQQVLVTGVRKEAKKTFPLFKVFTEWKEKFPTCFISQIRMANLTEITEEDYNEFIKEQELDTCRMKLHLPTRA